MNDEKRIIADWMDTPGTKLILRKLYEAADEAGKRYDHIVTERELVEIQQMRKVCRTVIPELMQRIVNRETKGPLWKFKEWLLS